MRTILTTAALLLTNAAAAQDTACIPAYQLDTFMAEQGMELIASPIIVTSMGEVDGLLYVSNIDGEWILVVTPPNGMACAALWGYDFFDGEAM